MSSSPSILIAIPREWSSLVCDYLEKQGLAVVAVHSREETAAMLQEPKVFRGLVIVSDWAMAAKGESTVGIVESIQGQIPTVTIITETSRQQSGYRYMDEVFFPPSHEYMAAPFDLDQLAACMQKVGMV